MQSYDVIIAGGGIAGLSAALILGRCRRTVLVCDTGKPRNAASRALHGFLSRDGLNPMQLREIAREDLGKYHTVTLMEGEVVEADANSDGYAVTLADGRSFAGRYLLVATGIVDVLPQIGGIRDFYGRNVFHCPYCDGWEVRDQPLAALGEGEIGMETALELTGWSSDVIFCTNGQIPPPEDRERLAKNGVAICTDPIRSLEKAEGDLVALMFPTGAIVRRAIFFTPTQYQASPLAEKLGCEISGGVVATGKFQQIHPRLFVAGDAARSVQLAIVAAAEGVEAAFAINTALLTEQLK